MDKRRRRIVLAVMVILGAMWAFVRRPMAMLVGAIVLYHYSPHLFGVTPLKPYELGELMTSRPEAAFAAAGTVVAVASMLAFKRVKRLDLELAAGSEISLVLKDGMDMMTRLRGFVVGIYEVRQMLEVFGPDCQMDPIEARSRMDVILIHWDQLKSEVPQLRKDQSAMWSISSRILDIETQHSAAIRAKALTPFALGRARRRSLQMAEKAGFLLPGDQDDVGYYLDGLEMYEGVSLADFLEADEKEWTSFLEWMGAASAIGSSSIALPSAITAGRTAWELLRMRD